MTDEEAAQSGRNRQSLSEIFWQITGLRSATAHAVMTELDRHFDVEWYFRDYESQESTQFLLVRIPPSIALPDTARTFLSEKGNLNLLVLYFRPYKDHRQQIFIIHLTDDEYTVFMHYDPMQSAIIIPNETPRHDKVVASVERILYQFCVRAEIEGLTMYPHHVERTENAAMISFPTPAIVSGSMIDRHSIEPEELIADMVRTYRLNLKTARPQITNFLMESGLVSRLQEGLSPVALSLIRHNIAAQFGYELPDGNGFREYMSLTEISDALAEHGYDQVHAQLIRRMIEKLQITNPEDTISGLDRALRINTLYSRSVAQRVLAEISRIPYLPHDAEGSWVSQKALSAELVSRSGILISETQIYHTIIPEFLAYIEAGVGSEAEYTSADAADIDAIREKRYGTFRPRMSLYVNFTAILEYIESHVGIYKDGTSMSQAPTHRALVQLRSRVENDRRHLERLTPEQRGAVNSFFALAEGRRYPSTEEHKADFPHDSETLTAAVTKLRLDPTQVLFYTGGKEVRPGMPEKIMRFIIEHPKLVDQVQIENAQAADVFHFMRDYFERTLTVPSYEEIITGLQAVHPGLKRDTLKITRQRQIIRAIDEILENSSRS